MASTIFPPHLPTPCTLNPIHHTHTHNTCTTYLVLLQRPASQDSWAPVLLHPAHSSERLALGAALLRMGAADALHPQFLAGVSGTMQHVADAVSVQASEGAG